MSIISWTDKKSLTACVGKASNKMSSAFETSECNAQHGVACLFIIKRHLRPGAFHFSNTATVPTCQDERGTLDKLRGCNLSLKPFKEDMLCKGSRTPPVSALCQIMLGSGHSFSWLKSNNWHAWSNTNFGHITASVDKLWSKTKTKDRQANVVPAQPLSRKWENHPGQNSWKATMFSNTFLNHSLRGMICTPDLAFLTKTTERWPDTRRDIIPARWQWQSSRPLGRTMQLFRPRNSASRSCDMFHTVNCYRRPSGLSRQHVMTHTGGTYLTRQPVIELAGIWQHIS